MTLTPKEVEYIRDAAKKEERGRIVDAVAQLVATCTAMGLSDDGQGILLDVMKAIDEGTI